MTSFSEWASHLGAATLRERRPRPFAGVAASVLAVTLATVAVFPLERIARVESLGVVYLPAVLLVSTYWGLGLGLLTSLLSAAAFNFFHLPPVGRFTIADSRNWVALAAFTIVAVTASTIAELARSRALEAERRRAEADLAATLARELLLGVDTGTALASAARRVAEALGLRSAAIEQGVRAAGGRQRALPLRGADGTQVATLIVPRDLPPDTEQRLREQVEPALEALVALAQRRDALQAELVETEALRRSDDIKTAVLRAVSHDLRTPLTAIVAAGHAPRSDWVSVEDLIAAATEGLRDQVVDVRLTVDPDVPEIRADAAQLERAFANLLENAARYGGGKPVVVHARRSSGRPDRVLISVVDRGPGIGSAEQERIFEPFYRGRSASASSATGSGLGLAIVKGFVEANGGSIAVHSLPGQGTSFVVSLPVAERSGNDVAAGVTGAAS
jgi:two-component system sensor histidine kinase KdpD